MGTLQQENPVHLKTSVTAHFTFSEEELSDLAGLLETSDITVNLSNFLTDLRHELRLLLQDK
jgi:hypothetical protein